MVTRFDASGWITARFGAEGTKGDEFELVIWDPDSDLPADNPVAGHQVLWEREVIFEVAGDD